MRLSAKFLGLTLLIFVFGIACEKEDPQNDPQTDFIEYETSHGEIGSGGGSVQVTNPGSSIDGSSISIPEGALSEVIEVSINEAQAPIAFLNDTLSVAVQLLPKNIIFDQPVKVTVPFPNNYSSLDTVNVYYYNEEDLLLHKIDVESVDYDNKTLTFKTDHFSIYYTTKGDIPVSIRMFQLAGKIAAEVLLPGGLKTIPIAWNRKPPQNIYQVLERRDYPKITYYVQLREKTGFTAINDPFISSDKVTLGANVGPGVNYTLVLWNKDDNGIDGVENRYNSWDIESAESFLIGGAYIFVFDGFQIDPNAEYYCTVTWNVQEYTPFYLVNDHREVAKEFNSLDLYVRDVNLNQIHDSWEMMKIDFSASLTSGVPPLKVQFSNLTSGPALDWLWDFGDGTSSTEMNPEHTFNSPGNYSIKLTASNTLKSSYLSKSDYIKVNQLVNSPTVVTLEAVSITQTTATIGGNVTDDGGSSITDNGVFFGTSDDAENEGEYFHIGTGSGKFSKSFTGLEPNTTFYFVAFAENSAGLSVGSVKSFTTASAGNKPIAEFSGNPTTTIEGGDVQFTDQSVNDPTSWSWDFGDGNSSSQKSPSHTYNSEGTYTVKLTASNNFGSDTEIKTNYISVNKAGSPPVAEFSTSKTSVNVGESIQFTDQSTNNPTSWSWDFGDGSIGTQQNPSHAYSNTGTYTVKLTVSNEHGSDIETKTNYITVSEAGSAPLAEFSASPTSIFVGSTVQFTDLSANNPSSWSWDFGDGGTSTLQNASHTYSTAGTYTVSLSVTNSHGSDTETKSNYITVSESSGGDDIVFNPDLTYGTMSDIDGNTYKTIQIGSQTWMAENLKVTHYANGTAIPPIESISEWDNLSYSDKAYSWYDNSTTNRDTYGGLYTWAAVMNGAGSTGSNPSGIQGVCPDGWHLPSDAEWKVLEMQLGMSQSEADAFGSRGIDESNKLKETGTTHWISPNTSASNESGFTALSGGYRYADGRFSHVGQIANFWSTTEHSDSGTVNRTLNNTFDPSKVARGVYLKDHGCSVRCVGN